MKVTTEVKDKGEADALRAAMDDPTTRAFVIVVGTLLPLGHNTRRRILQFVSDKLSDEEQGAKVRIETNPEKPLAPHRVNVRVGKRQGTSTR